MAFGSNLAVRGRKGEVVIKKIAETGQKMRCGGKRWARANETKAKRRGESSARRI